MRFVAENLAIHSGPGQRAKRSMVFLRDADRVSCALEELAAVQQHFEQQAVTLRRDLAEMVLCQMQDVHGSVENLRAQRTSDDVELFEPKHFALQAMCLRDMVAESQFPTQPIPDLTASLELLDPQARRIPEFFIYDEYSHELTAARRTLIILQQQWASEEAQGQQRLDCLAIEDRIRRDLVLRLRSYAEALDEPLVAVVTAHTRGVPPLQGARLSRRLGAWPAWGGAAQRVHRLPPRAGRAWRGAPRDPAHCPAHGARRRAPRQLPRIPRQRCPGRRLGGIVPIVTCRYRCIRMSANILPDSYC